MQIEPFFWTLMKRFRSLLISYIGESRKTFLLTDFTEIFKIMFERLQNLYFF